MKLEVEDGRKRCDRIKNFKVESYNLDSICQHGDWEKAKLVDECIR